MAYRLTSTEKWGDSWFCSLKPIEKLLFMYLCDNCNLAGFIEYIPRRWAFDMGTDQRGIEDGLKGLQRGIYWSKEKDCLYICNFLKHQKNYPLNEKNLAHQSIIKMFANYAHKFDIDNVNDFIERGCKGDIAPYSNSNSNSHSNVVPIVEIEPSTWKGDFSIYIEEAKSAYIALLSNEKWIKERERFNPNVDIKLTVEKAFTEYWGTEAGWKKKKSSRSNTIDWNRTYTSAIGINKVYKPRVNGWSQEVSDSPKRVTVKGV